MSINMLFVQSYGVCVLMLCLMNMDMEVRAAGMEVLPLADYFKNCKVGKPGFDDCLKIALNAVRPLFKAGVSEYGVRSFDPHFIATTSDTRGVPGANLTITLTDVREYDWTISEVIKFESDLVNNLIRYQQTFPDKTVTGAYDLEVNLAGFSYRAAGNFTFRFFDWVQTMTVTRPRMVTSNTTSHGPIQVDVVNTDIGFVTWHFSNLVWGKVLPEKLVDHWINFYWRPLFSLARPVLNVVASKGFTAIFNDSFANFPFDTFFS